MTNYNTLEALVHTWSPRFVPFLDEEQWEPYVEEEGPRRRARYAMEMDRVKLGRSKRSKVNSKSVKDRHEIRCSKCHKAGHNR
jgi:hypothetical protein